MWKFLRRTIAAQIHLVAGIAAILGTAVLVQKCALHQNPNHIRACWVFGLTSTFLFFISAIYHFLHDGFGLSKTWETRFENLDHLAIYCFIAATYTVVLMNTVANPWANNLMIAIWFLAFFGTLYSIFRDRLALWAQNRFIYTGYFVAMGWLFMLRAGEITGNLSAKALLFFSLSAISYTSGALIYALKTPNIIKNVFGYHELFHLLGFAGYGFHYWMILGFY